MIFQGPKNDGQLAEVPDGLGESARVVEVEAVRRALLAGPAHSQKQADTTEPMQLADHCRSADTQDFRVLLCFHCCDRISLPIRYRTSCSGESIAVCLSGCLAELADRLD